MNWSFQDSLSFKKGTTSQLLNDQHLGRPSKKADTLLKDYPDVVRAYENGLSLRKASAETGRAVNTIRKVYDVLKAMS